MTLTEHIDKHLDVTPGITRKDIATSLGRPYSTVQKELNTYYFTAKIGIDLLIPICKIIGWEPLINALDDAGMCLAPSCPRKPDAQDMPTELLQIIEAFQVLKVAVDNNDHYGIRRAVGRIAAEARDVQTRYEQECDR
jgi:hypothetical protein